MRLLAIADRKPSKSIKQLLTEHPVDAVVTLGDLDYFSLAELANITNVPKLGVYGNHCSGNYMEQLGITNMHLKTVRVGDLLFGGFQGSVRYKESPSAIMYTQEEALAMLKDFPRVDVMLVHCPPYGVNDEPGDPSHEGFIGLRDYVLGQKPHYLLHGHTYPTEQTLVKKLGDTEIVYVYGDKVVTL